MTIKQLLDLGLLNTGELVIWNRRGLKTSHEATIQSDGSLLTEDGKRHRTPSGAAKHLNGNKPVDGWLAWKVKRNGLSLADIRKKNS